MAGKEIFGNARIKYRSDTLNAWNENNPVLLSGEFGVVTGLNSVGDGLENGSRKVKIGDGIHNWKELQWWNDFTVDQSYSPESENPQSAVAVEEALSTVGGDYEHIETITTTEEVLSIKIETEPNGERYNFKKLQIIITVPKTATTYNIRTFINNQYCGAIVSGYNASWNAVSDVEFIWVEAIRRTRAYIGKHTNSLGNPATLQSTFATGVSEQPYTAINNLWIDVYNGTIAFPIGTKLEIYGVRA
jgi:hypothetical protein